MSRSSKDGRGGHAKRGLLYGRPRYLEGKVYSAPHHDYKDHYGAYAKKRMSRAGRIDAKRTIDTAIKELEVERQEYIEELRGVFEGIFGRGGSDYIDDDDDWHGGPEEEDYTQRTNEEYDYHEYEYYYDPWMDDY